MATYPLTTHALSPSKICRMARLTLSAAYRGDPAPDSAPVSASTHFTPNAYQPIESAMTANYTYKRGRARLICGRPPPHGTLSGIRRV